MNNPLRILLIDDNPDYRMLIKRALSRECPGLHLTEIIEANGFSEALEAGHFDLVITDYRLRWTEGLKVLQKIKARYPDCPVIMFTATGNEEIAVQTMKAGLDDYVLKSPKRIDRLPAIVKSVWKQARQREQLKVTEQALRQANAIIENSAVVVFRFRREEGWPIEYVSQQVDQFGYDAKEFADKTVSYQALISPEDRDRVRREINEFCTQGMDHFRQEYRIYGKDQAIHWVKAICTAERDSAGQVAYYQGLLLDINQRKHAEKALKDKQAILQTIFDHIPIMISLVDGNGQFKIVNKEWEQVLGWSFEELSGVDILAECYPDPDARQETLDYIQKGTAGWKDFRTRVRNGRVIDTAWSIVGLADGATIGFGQDMTERKRTEDQLRQLLAQVEEQKQLLNTILSASADFIFLHDSEGRYRFASEPALQALGLEKDHIEGKTWRELGFPEEAMGSFDADLESVFATGLPVTREIRFPFGAEMRDLETILSPVRDVQGQVSAVVSTVRDVTERKQYEARLQYQVHYDALTGLPNRTLLKDRLEHALVHAERTGGRVAVLFLDLDHFKLINDSLGHGAGDALLQAVAERLTASVHRDDTVARLGSDEFVIVLENLADEESVAVAARKSMTALETPFVVNHQELFIDCSIGISVFPRDGNTAETLIKNADAALHRAKERGRRSLQFYTAEMNARIIERLTLENGLRHALEGGELELHYQPQVDLVNGRIIGVEALLRWRHPQWGMISPGEFIPLAEANGLIVPMGEWALRIACTQARAWQVAGLPEISVSVNLSSRQFAQADLIDRLAQILRETTLDASHLELEITESLLMEDVEGAIVILKALKDMGVHLAIDDFGTGYSSLNYLKRFPIDRLKIDQSFVRDITTDPGDAAIAQAVISLAHSLRLKVTAEGVESKTQLSFLKTRSCDEAQGYYFGRPIPAEEMAILLQQWETLYPVSQAVEDGRPAVLLVDDDANMILGLSRLLQRDGYPVLTARSAQEALDRLARQRVGVVISDQRMPGMSGTEFFSRIRDLYPNTVRILLSGYGSAEDLIEAINEGDIYRFLTKPVNIGQLRAALHKAFRLYESNCQQRKSELHLLKGHH